MTLNPLKSRPLAKGQVWKTRLAHFEILALNQDFIHYKVTKNLGAKEISAQVSGLEAMANYLARHQAELVASKN